MKKTVLILIAVAMAVTMFAADGAELHSGMIDATSHLF